MFVFSGQSGAKITNNLFQFQFKGHMCVPTHRSMHILYFTVVSPQTDNWLMFSGGHASQQNICCEAPLLLLRDVMGTLWLPLTATSMYLVVLLITRCPTNCTAMMWILRPGKWSTPVWTARCEPNAFPFLQLGFIILYTNSRSSTFDTSKSNYDCTCSSNV